MKKLIIALDGQHFPEGAFEFVKNINSRSKILLAGIFLSPVDYSKALVFTGIEGVSITPEGLMTNEDDILVDKNIIFFKEACTTGGIEFRIHKDTDLMALASLIEETRFADALLLSSDLFYANVSKEQPNFYMEEVLKKAECPVMLIPENYKEPGHIMLTYDGSESSVFAIKQFAYVFPELADKETMLLSINSHDDLPDHKMITELVKGHYPELKPVPVHIKDKNDFTKWALDQPDSFIVMGAFSRSLFSQIFKKSFASDIIHDIKMPIFISHK